MLPTSTLGSVNTMVLTWNALVLTSVRSDGLAVSGNHGSIGVNGAALDVGHLEAATLVRHAHGRQFLAFFREHFDAHVIAVVVEIIVSLLFAIEVDRIGSRRTWGRRSSAIPLWWAPETELG